MSINVDIIVPVYNAEKYLDECIKSVLEQTYPYFTLTLVDDGSTDRSLSVCEKWEKADNRIQVIHKENGGLVSAWLLGLKSTINDWVIFIDSDDWMERCHVETLVANQEKTGADIVVTNMRQMGIGINEIMPFCVEEKCYKGDLLEKELYPIMLNAGGFEMRGIPVSRCSKLIRKELMLDNIKYISETTTYEEDLNIMFPAMLDAKAISLVSAIDSCYCYRRVENSMLHGYDGNMLQSIVHIYPAIRLACKEKNKEYFLPQVDYEYATAIIRSATNELQNPKGLSETQRQFGKLSRDTYFINVLKRIDCRKIPMRFKIVIHVLSNYDFVSRNIIVPILVMAKRCRER